MVLATKKDLTIEAAESLKFSDLMQLVADQTQLSVDGMRFLHKSKILDKNASADSVVSSPEYPIIVYGKPGKAASTPSSESSPAPKPSLQPRNSGPLSPFAQPRPSVQPPSSTQGQSLGQSRFPVQPQPYAQFQPYTQPPSQLQSPSHQQPSEPQSPFHPPPQSPFLDQSGALPQSSLSPQMARPSSQFTPQGQPPSSSLITRPEAVAHLTEMGFDAEKVQEALRLCRGQIDSAAELLALGDVSEAGLERLGLSFGPEPSTAIPLNRCPPQFQMYLIQRLQTDPSTKDAWAQLQDGKPIRIGVPYEGVERHVYISPEMVNSAFVAGPQPGYGGFGGLGTYGAPVGFGRYRHHGGWLVPNAPGGFGTPAGPLGPDMPVGYRRPGAFGGSGGIGPPGGPLGSGMPVGLDTPGESYGPSEFVTANQQRRAEMEQGASNAIRGLTESERQVVTQLAQEGFNYHDACQVFLLTNKDANQTREILRTMK